MCIPLKSSTFSSGALIDLAPEAKWHSQSVDKWFIGLRAPYKGLQCLSVFEKGQVGPPQYGPPVKVP